MTPCAPTMERLAVRPDSSQDAAACTHELVLRLTISGEPAAKKRPVTINRAGKVWTFTPKETVQAERAILTHAARTTQAMNDPLGSYAVTLRFFSGRPDGKKRPGDLDNYVKLVLDALTPPKSRSGRLKGLGLLWQDDRQVVQLHASRHDRQDTPRTEITVYREVNATGRGASEGGI